MKIREFIIMPHTADPMGLIHRPGVGPNNRFDFKNKGNNKANEKAPPGREKQVKALKGKVDNPYAVAWASYNKSKNEEAAGVGIVTKQNATKDVPVGGQYMNVKKLGLGKGKPKTMKEEFAEFLENIDPKVWTELRAKGLVRPMHFDSPEVRAAYKEKGLPYKPDISIITKDNLDQFRTKEPERLKQLKPIQVSDQQWINYMDKWWRTERLKPKAKDKVQQIKNAYKLLYKKDMVENFADGKKKGKSRPGRVKRSGASCNGSVTALRKRAKNSSGEKAKMYHWCANMKSGRKKK